MTIGFALIQNAGRTRKEAKLKGFQMVVVQLLAVLIGRGINLQ